MLKEKINSLIVRLEEIAEYLYQQEVEKAYQLLNMAIPELADCINQMYVVKIQNGAITFDENILSGKLGEALGAMEQKDYILIADIIKYEIIEELNQFNTQIL